MSADRSPIKFDANNQRSRTAGLIRFVSFTLCVFAIGGLVITLLFAPHYIKLDPASSAGINSDQQGQQPQKLQNLQTSNLSVSPLIPLPTATITPEPTIIPTAVANGCIPWSGVTLEDVGKQTCVQGTYQREEVRQDGVRILIFGENEGAFQVWSSSRPFSWYLKGDQSRCMLFRETILTTGVRPIMILRSNSRVEVCE